MAYAGLVRDTKYPNMWRIKYEDGELSDMYNISWAKHHLKRYLNSKNRERNDRKKDR